MKWNKRKIDKIIEAIFIVIGGAVTILSALPKLYSKVEGNKTYEILVILLFLLTIGVLIYLIVFQINEIFRSQWVECRGFPNQDRICNAVKDYITKETYTKCYGDRVMKKECAPALLFNDFLEVISNFLKYSSDSLIMTLPSNPYDQIDNKQKKNLYRNTVKNIKFLSHNKLSQRKKIICLSEDSLSKFKSNFLTDLKDSYEKATKQSKRKKRGNILFNNDIKIDTQFENYLNYHKDTILLSWNVGHVIEEFIVIDNSVFIAIEENKEQNEIENRNINIIFSQRTIREKRDKFYGIGENLNTHEFLQEYVINDHTFLDSYFSDSAKQEYIKKYISAL
jgi:uncharacterized protein with PQ loop repeat